MSEGQTGTGTGQPVGVCCVFKSGGFNSLESPLKAFSMTLRLSGTSMSHLYPRLCDAAGPWCVLGKRLKRAVTDLLVK